MITHEPTGPCRLGLSSPMHGVVRPAFAFALGLRTRARGKCSRACRFTADAERLKRADMARFGSPETIAALIEGRSEWTQIVQV
jgi:hypothetical protein